jgi:hypothetical protein
VTDPLRLSVTHYSMFHYSIKALPRAAHSTHSVSHEPSKEEVSAHSLRGAKSKKSSAPLHKRIALDCREFDPPRLCCPFNGVSGDVIGPQ